MPTIHYEKRDDHIVVMTMEGDNDLNIGVVNAELHDRIDEFAADDGLWCAVITGAGRRAFSAGGDMKRRAAFNAGELLEPAGSPAYNSSRPTIITGLPMWKPVIAAVNGYCLGAAFALALACDIRVASENAEFSMPELKLGSPGSLGVPQRLPRLIPLGPALEMLLTGDRINAQQALQWGLVNRVVPQPDLMDAALEMARRVVANPPLGVRSTKEAVIRSLEMPFAEAMRLTTLLYQPNRGTEDAKEAHRARIEKRKPVYRGR
ncbi:MAG TPA: enoyl-CoA hydratase-related protein [Chloroflexota bacterium]|nr:enoyl-CoA hydratase-related protein [Chloroflexota bacterium]